MTLNISDQVGAVTRGVTSKTDSEGRSLRVVTAGRTFSTDIDDLWDAITNPERLPRWFMPVSGDLRLGGRYELEGNASGEVTGCEPPRRLSVTWEFGGQVSWLDVVLAESGDDNGGGGAGGGARTELTLEHAASVEDDLWDTFGPGAVGVGWDLALHGLALHIDGAPPIDPAEAAIWHTTDEGRRFIELSSEGWGLASAGFGTDEQAATEAAARTTAFYTGEDTPDGHDAGGSD